MNAGFADTVAENITSYGKALMKDVERPSSVQVLHLEGIEIPMDNEYMLIIPHLTLSGTGSYSDTNHSKHCKKTSLQLYHDYVLQLVGIGFNPIQQRVIDGDLLASVLVGFRLNGQTVRRDVAIAQAMQFKLMNLDNFPVALPGMTLR